MIIMIIGASGGLGKSLVSKLSKEQEHKLILCSSKKLTNISPEYSTLYLDFFDVTYKKTISDFFSNIIPDVVIHCSGRVFHNDNHPIDANILQKTLQLNLYGAIEINKILIKKIINSNKHCKIIHVGSDSGISGYASPCYSISKGALHTYIKNISREYINNNLEICGIVPSIFEHENSIWQKRKISDNKKYQERLSIKPLKRFANVNDISEIILMIAFSKTNIFAGELLVFSGGEI